MGNNVPWWVLPSLAVIVLGIVAAALVASCFFEDGSIRNVLFGGVLAFGSQVISYYFGSSSGSAKKDDTIAKLQGPPP